MRAALDWIAATLSPPSTGKAALSALDDPFYQSNSSDHRIDMTDISVSHSYNNGDEGVSEKELAAIQREREDRLCEEVYTRLSREIPRVTKSSLYMNDLITSAEMDKNGHLLQRVYWMGQNHLYATVFLSCRNTPATELYRKAYITDTMGGMKMIGIPGDSIDMIVDALWNHMIKQGFKVYDADGKEEVQSQSTRLNGHHHRQGEEESHAIVSVAAAAAAAASGSGPPAISTSNSNNGPEREASSPDVRVEEDTKRANLRRAAAAAARRDAETDKNK